MEDALRRYIEDIALFFEKSGLPRIAGRILGLLLICDPPHRSASELAEEVGASKASVSTMTRMLLSAGLIERVGVPGERSTHFALRDDGFERTFEVRMKGLVGFGPLAERGLQLLANEGSGPSRHLRELAALYEFWGRELPLLLDKWKQERARLRKEQDP